MAGGRCDLQIEPECSAIVAVLEVDLDLTVSGYAPAWREVIHTVLGTRRGTFDG